MHDYGAILSQLSKLRQHGAGSKWQWSAICPAHNDGRPSLSLKIGDEGCLIAKCWSGCTFAAIVAATGTKSTDWFPPKDNQERGRTVQKKVAATYDYRDEAGNLVYQKLRYEPKEFAFRRPDGSDGWAWNMNGVEHVLYRLPELIASAKVDDGKQLPPVIVVEGEKDVESLRALGYIATTCDGGAGGWSHDLGAALKGRRVVVIPDNDAPGRRYARDVAGSLLLWGAESVRVVYLPGLGDGGDVTDWLTDGLPTVTRDPGSLRRALNDYIRAYPEWKPFMPVYGSGLEKTKSRAA